MLFDKLLSRYGLLENYTSGVMGTETGTTEVTTKALCNSCSRAKRSCHGQGYCSISLHFLLDRFTRFYNSNTIIYIQGMPGCYGYLSLELIYTVRHKLSIASIVSKKTKEAFQS